MKLNNNNNKNVHVRVEKKIEKIRGQVEPNTDTPTSETISVLFLVESCSIVVRWTPFKMYVAEHLFERMMRSRWAFGMHQ